MKQTLAVRAIIKQDQKILLLRRATGNPIYVGLYELPGGKVEFGEDPRASLQGEVLRGTGREVETMQLYEVYSELDVRDLQHQYVTLVFLATLKPETAILLDENYDKFVWKKMSEIQLNELTETTRLSLQIEKSAGQTDQNSNDLQNIDDKITTDEAIIYTDGGSRGNPGPSASGFVIKNMHNQTIFEGGKYLGVTTNNQAEYQAVKLALEKAYEMGVRAAKLRLDSQLVVNQVLGLYKIKNVDLLPIHASIKDLTQKFERVTFTHVRREFNREADAMVNKILDEHEG